MNEERPLKAILLEALTLHNKTVKECQEQVDKWKTKFEQLSVQKHKYQDEYRNVKKEAETICQENNKLKGEVDSLRQLINRDQRPDKCSACSSFQHTIQTLKDVYEKTIDQKNDHISYLEKRIKELERQNTTGNIGHTSRTSSPDSTCQQTSSDRKSHDQEASDRSDKGLKLRLPRNKKRSRYSEDPSPELKRSRLNNTTKSLPEEQSSKAVSPNIIVPETCAFDDEIIEEECDTHQNHKETALTPIAKNEHYQSSKNRHQWNTAIESSSSDNEESLLGNPERVSGQGQVKSSRSWLQSMLSSPDVGKATKCENGPQSVSDVRSTLKKSTSDPSEVVRSNLPDDHDLTFMSESQGSLKVIPIRNRKVGNRRNRIGLNVSKVPELDESNQPRKGRTSQLTPVLPSSGSSEKPIDVPSDNESPLILRSSGKIDNIQRYPEVDVLFESSDESPTHQKSINSSASNPVRKVRNHKSRSQERSPDLDLSLKTGKLRQQEKLKGAKNSPKVAVLCDVDDNLKLKQSTLSQAFMNTTKQDTDLQKAIQKSLEESKTGSPAHEEVVGETKENTPPFKVPSIPKLKTRRNRTIKSPPDLDHPMPPNDGSKRSPDHNFSESMLQSMPKGDNSQHVIVNGSLDPAIELSQLCADSQSLGHCLEDQSELMLKNEKNGHQTTTNTRQPTSPSIDSIDFRLEDLHNHGDVPKTSTCIEQDSQSIPCSSTSVKFGKIKGKGRNLKIGGDTEEIDEDQKSEILEHKPVMDDSFDIRPKKADEGPGYAYVDVVRGKDNRRKLPAFWCQECADYYLEPGADEQEVWEKMQKCSKHRARAPPPSTPPNFWEVGFPDTMECEDRGYINWESSEEKKKPALRERPNKYRQLFKSKSDKGGNPS